VPDVIVISAAILLHDQLGIVQYETAHHGQSRVQIQLENETRSKEQIDDRHPEHRAEQRNQRASEIQVFAIRSVNCGRREAREYDTRSEKGRRNDGWINSHDVIDQRAGAQSAHERKAHIIPQTQMFVSSIVRRSVQQQQNHDGAERTQKVRSQNIGENVNVGAQSSREQRNGQTTVDLLQMLLQALVQFLIQRIEEFVETGQNRICGRHFRKISIGTVQLSVQLNEN